MRIIATVAGLLLAITINACGTTDAAGELVVQQNDRVLQRFSLHQLRDLPQIEVPTPQSGGAHVQKGPTVRSIVNAAGVTDIESVRVEGRDPAQTLVAAELTDRVILSITKRNTVKLTGTPLPRDRWVRDVVRLVVNS
ncbi:hypothetical protein A5645_01295 [Mycobacterium asiaticum]|uniref:hypothetical protein n=1 Tax=Mycobacterium asiaticum TaxID=1790 RepID=UPI0007EFB99F|nr:hypothetical protein [Mycobacterium asiaticum]OBK97146.1 hypothetical protein A5645_01295 [Mycobacterium asiaticum]